MYTVKPRNPKNPCCGGWSTCPEPTGTPLEIAQGIVMYLRNDIDPAGEYDLLISEWEKCGRSRRLKDTVVATFRGSELLAAPAPQW